ncbi:MAG: lipid-A-disaccharide synthase N-terminal domain-containing protein [Rhodospirillaceae bacterium]
MSWFPDMVTSDVFWIGIGFGGQALFSARFLYQWLKSEQAGRCVVPAAFWYLSFFGGLTLLAYAVYKKDPVFILGQAMGVLIYTRNIWLIRAERRQCVEVVV